MKAPSRPPVIVVGAGLGGLVTALELAPLPVLLLSRGTLGLDTASAWAQGGIAAAVGADDSPALHAADTVTAGDGLCVPGVVDLVTREAPACIERLRRYGAGFDRDAAGHLALGREGGHNRRRIVHARDATGYTVTRALLDAARRTPSITLLENVSVDELLVVDGRVAGLLARRDGEQLVFSASAIVLATGGSGGLYWHTSNPLGARASGLVMAARAGALLADLEFVQFHPTALDLGIDPMPLATEALRGEGAVLVDSAGERFMLDVHPLAELAPRDVVARAIHRQRAAGQTVYLDATRSPGPKFATAFPTVYESCIRAGIDPSRQPMPVAPAAHYHMGGIAVDIDGQSTVPGLWAVGETACTGLHGANRLASNSLLEAVVFGVRAARDIASRPRPAPDAPRAPRMARRPEAATAAAALSRVRRVMEADVGVERDAAGLARAIGMLDDERRSSTDPAVVDAATAALLLAVPAMARCESRGGHFRTDYPLTASEARRSLFGLQDIEQGVNGARSQEEVAFSRTG